VAHRPYHRVLVGRDADGSPILVNLRTWAMLDVARDRLGFEEPLTIVQGSYHRTSPESAGTHDGGGVVDLSPFDADRKVHVLRAIGFAAWHRPRLLGHWEEHIHAIAIGDREMSPEARAQVRDYYAHRDGLAGHLPDPTWHPNPIPVFDFRKWRKEHTLLESDKAWLDRRFDALHEQLSTFRQASRERDHRLAARLRHLAETLRDTSTKEQIRRARADITEILELLEQDPGNTSPAVAPDNT